MHCLSHADILSWTGDTATTCTQTRYAVPLCVLVPHEGARTRDSDSVYLTAQASYQQGKTVCSCRLSSECIRVHQNNCAYVELFSLYVPVLSRERSTGKPPNGAALRVQVHTLVLILTVTAVEQLVLILRRHRACAWVKTATTQRDHLRDCKTKK